MDRYPFAGEGGQRVVNTADLHMPDVPSRELGAERPDDPRGVLGFLPACPQRSSDARPVNLAVVIWRGTVAEHDAHGSGGLAVAVGARRAVGGAGRLGGEAVHDVRPFGSLVVCDSHNAVAGLWVGASN